MTCHGDGISKAAKTAQKRVLKNSKRRVSVLRMIAEGANWRRLVCMANVDQCQLQCTGTGGSAPFTVAIHSGQPSGQRWALITDHQNLYNNCREIENKCVCWFAVERRKKRSTADKI